MAKSSAQSNASWLTNVPWSVLRYNEDLDAYELNVADEQLRRAPLDIEWESGMVGRDWERNVHDYYRASPYW